MYSVCMHFKKFQQYHCTHIKEKPKSTKKIIIFIIIILLSVCRLLATEFFEQMKKTDHKEDIPQRIRT